MKSEYGNLAYAGKIKDLKHDLITRKNHFKISGVIQSDQ